MAPALTVHAALAGTLCQLQRKLRCRCINNMQVSICTENHLL